jgi:hypothetical protein
MKVIPWLKDYCREVTPIPKLFLKRKHIKHLRKCYGFNLYANKKSLDRLSKDLAYFVNPLAEKAMEPLIKGVTGKKDE